MGRARGAGHRVWGTASGSVQTWVHRECGAAKAGEDGAGLLDLLREVLAVLGGAKAVAPISPTLNSGRLGAPAEVGLGVHPGAPLPAPASSAQGGGSPPEAPGMWGARGWRRSGAGWVWGSHPPHAAGAPAWQPWGHPSPGVGEPGEGGGSAGQEGPRGGGRTPHSPQHMGDEG